MRRVRHVRGGRCEPGRAGGRRAAGAERAAGAGAAGAAPGGGAARRAAAAARAAGAPGAVGAGVRGGRGVRRLGGVRAPLGGAALADDSTRRRLVTGPAPGTARRRAGPRCAYRHRSVPGP
ncbi:hypothetical protein SGPA1_12234 [Streptomyces misionensis JCM 4497]